VDALIQGRRPSYLPGAVHPWFGTVFFLPSLHGIKKVPALISPLASPSVALSQHEISTRTCVTSQTNNTTNTQTLAGPTSLMQDATREAGLEAIDVAQSQSEPSSAARIRLPISHSLYCALCTDLVVFGCFCCSYRITRTVMSSISGPSTTIQHPRQDQTPC
jgi:hypothetical protein